MNSKERVQTALHHQEPDRVPLDFWWSREIMHRLLRTCGLQDQETLQDYLGSDIRSVYPAYIGPPLQRLSDGSYEDFWGVFRTPFSHSRSGEYDEVTSPLLTDAARLEDIDRIRWPSPDWFDYESLIPQCQKYRDYAIMVGKMGRESQTLFIQLWYYRGLEKILIDLIEWPEFVERLIGKIMEFRLQHIERMLAVVKGRADILQIADDYGTQNGLIMSVQLWKRFFAAHLKQIAGMAHAAGLKVFLHSDGGIRPLIPDLIDIGIDILNPIQPAAAGMDPSGLKRDFGENLCFHGGIDTQRTLPFGTREEVIREVEERISVLGKDGGYILAPVHTVEPDVPVENVLAVYDTVKARK